MDFSKRDIELLYEVGSMRNVPRGWRQHLGKDCASVLEHTIRVIWLALLIARKEGVKNEEKIMKMALMHDLDETRVSDLSYVQKVYVKADEDKACKDALDGTMFPDFYQDIFHEFENRESIEAKIVKDADNLDIDLEGKELEKTGSKVIEQWKVFRKKVREEKLYTQSAKELWDLIQTVDVDSWHNEANKWLKMPEAGT